MTGLFGWVPDAVDDVWRTLAAMGSALRANADEQWALHTIDGIGIGVLDGIEPERVEEWIAPVISADGDHMLWLAGEIFEAGADTPPRPQDAATPQVRARLLARLIDQGPAALRTVDGEFQIAWWHRGARRLTLLTDRFGALPWYWARGNGGVAFACGVRGVLAAPGVSSTPDREALRDAVTFGGFRLGNRTNVDAVRMLPCASAAVIANGALVPSRWWRLTELATVPYRSLDEVIEGAHERWQRAIARRLRGAEKPGQTLSGGLDSRAILAEAAPQAPAWTAITYGVPGCDDARYAEQAARSVNAEWIFYPLYQDDWLAARSAHIQQTDGLIQLADLMHLESLPLQRQSLDVHLSGYIGDAVAGPTFNDIDSPEAALVALPYYETAISRPWTAALARVAAATDDPEGLTTAYVPFEHKLPQSTNRWSAAWRPWIRVRRPFTDYEFFDFCRTLHPQVRGPIRFYERWLRRKYPQAFARIPNHKTGAPAAASIWELTRARAGRAVKRTWRRVATRIEVPTPPWSRAFHDEHGAWRAPDARRTIESTILRPGSIAVEEWGRAAIVTLLNDWFDREQGPTQVIGALYAFEAYHAGLPSHLSAAALSSTRRIMGVTDVTA